MLGTNLEPADQCGPTAIDDHVTYRRLVEATALLTSDAQVCALTLVVFLSVKPATLAAGSVPAMVRTTIFLAAYEKALPRSISRFPNTTSLKKAS